MGEGLEATQNQQISADSGAATLRHQGQRNGRMWVIGANRVGSRLVSGGTESHKNRLVTWRRAATVFALTVAMGDLST